MRFSEAWLREWVNPPIDTAALASQFTMAGLEVDAIEPAALAFDKVVVGHVLQRDQHPDADKLSVCRVDVGGDEPLQIVCGARNVAAGMKVVVATVGATLPNDFKIKPAKLRGVQSLGMICSASELGLAESSEGILPLAADAQVGRDFRDYLQLDDHIIELDLTPDRGDCLGILGLAREVGALNRVEVTPPDMPLIPARHSEIFPVEVQAPESCPRYACRVIKGVNPAAVTPLWMKERLRRSGIRSIDAIVDVTNYVMLELGQPMHAFDLAQLSGGIQVRLAQAGESITLLDGKLLALQPDTLLIADHNKPLALAGIMGGAGSGIGTETRDVLLESAFFAPLVLSGKARRYGLHTDSSHRFERGVDPDLQVRAIERATDLLVQIAGGEPGPVVDHNARAGVAMATIPLRRERIQRLLGIEVPDATVIDCLTRLGMEVELVKEGWVVTPPACRFDISIEVDLIEEVGRVYGYEQIPCAVPRIPMGMELRPEQEFDLGSTKERLAALGYREVITYSFVGPEWAERVTPGVEAVPLANPISVEMSVMRTSLWPGLIQTAQHNLARQQSRIRIFEFGLKFRRQAGDLYQEPVLAMLIAGPVSAEQWGQAARQADFFDLKGDVESLLRPGGDVASYAFEAGEHPALHPGQCARIVRGGEEVGYMGMLHPRLTAELDLDQNYLLVELRLPAIRQGRLPSFAPLSKFPSIRRDIALVVDRELDFASVERCICNHSSEILKEIILFDVYTGEKIDSRRKSLALGLILQASSRTLTDQEVEEMLNAVLHGLSSELGAQLRD